VKSIKRRI